MFCSRWLPVPGQELVETAHGITIKHTLEHVLEVGHHDVLWFARATLSGSVIGPILSMVGLRRVDRSMATLLLTLEGAATALIAWLGFRVNFDRRIAAGMSLIVAGAVVLTRRGVAIWPERLGPVVIIDACVAWGVDNNLTGKVPRVTQFSSPCRRNSLPGW
jgi:drug/metabolite transporter (DMT)-like permease